MNNTHNLNLPDSSNLHFLHFNDLSFPTGCLSVSVSVSTSPGPSEREVNQNIRLFSEICGFWLGTDSRVTSRNQRLQYQRRFPQNGCYSASNCSLWYSAEKTGKCKKISSTKQRNILKQSCIKRGVYEFCWFSSTSAKHPLTHTFLLWKWKLNLKRFLID